MDKNKQTTKLIKVLHRHDKTLTLRHDKSETNILRWFMTLFTKSILALTKHFSMHYLFFCTKIIFFFFIWKKPRCHIKGKKHVNGTLALFRCPDMYLHLIFYYLISSLQFFSFFCLYQQHPKLQLWQHHLLLCNSTEYWQPRNNIEKRNYCLYFNLSCIIVMDTLTQKKIIIIKKSFFTPPRKHMGTLIKKFLH